MEGYEADDVIGRNHSLFVRPEDIARGYPGLALDTAAAAGQHEAEGWRVRKDGSILAHVVITL